MKIHKEGQQLVAVTAVLLLMLYTTLYLLAPGALPLALALSIFPLAFMLWFFRHPAREIETPDEDLVYSPADGRVVVIEEVEEPEYFRERKLQISIFMSPTDVHLNRVPVSGKVSYYRYHPGRYLVAWHPKSSLENERSTIVIDTGSAQILLRQIAGAMARRIRTYVSHEQPVQQGEELGFIKFGSRVDLMLPLEAEVMVKQGQKVYSNRTVIARLNPEF